MSTSGGTPAPNPRLTLLACILGTTVVLLDGTVVNVALPAIRGELGGGLAGQQWAVNAYLLTLGSLLLVGGALGDRHGERRVFALGVTGFGLTSLLCALAPTIELLVAGRALQGVAGALLVPSALAVIVSTFAAGERSRAIGTWTAWSGIGAALGPFVGGWLVEAATWRLVFAINVPLVAATVWLVLRAVPRTPPRAAGRLDLVGGALCALGLAAGTFALVQQPLRGWGSGEVLGGLAAGAFLLAAFVAHERRTAEPMLPLGLFRRRNFAVANAETLLVYAGLNALLFYLVIFLQETAGFSPLEAGAAGVPTTVVMLALAGRFGGLADRLGPRRFMAGGPLLAACGFLLTLRVGADASYWTDVLPAMAVFALGLSMTVAPLTATVLADADEHNAGTASGANNAIARVAGLVGVSVVGLALSATLAGSLDRPAAAAGLGDAGRSALREARRTPLAQPPLDAVPAAERPAVRAAVTGASEDAFHAAMLVGAGLLAAGGLLALVGIRDPRRVVAARDCPGGQVTGQPVPPETAPQTAEVG